VNWADLNPVKRKPKVVGEAVYVAVTLDKPLGGITLKEPKDKPWIKVRGLSLEAAAELIPGRSINWHTVPMEFRAKLELDLQSAELGWEQLKIWMKG
jgi:hypothetical protein